jgi:polar amino acid transport system substrate-binding protein
MVAIYIGLILVAQFTASITTSVIVRTIHGDISGPSDLPGKRVATVRGSTAAHYLRAVGAVPVEFDDIGNALAAVRDRQAAAAVYDAPVMLYYLNQDGTKFFRMAGAPFRHEGYGILLPPNSPYRKRVDQALLELRESCAYQRLYQKWFGLAVPCIPSGNPARYAKSE